VSATIDYFRELDTEPYGVNHADAASHQAFIDELQLSFDLLVDEDLGVSELYGCLREGERKIARTVVIVGKNGQVIYRASGSPPVDELLEAISTASDDTAP
jgi:peroxiredoxin